MYDSTKPYKYHLQKKIKQTWKTPYVVVDEGIYPTFKKTFHFPEVSHTDGIGTKALYHWREKTLHNAVIDALAMNLNDLLLVGAQAYTLQNHLILPKDDHKAIAEIIGYFAKECKKRSIAMTGGETSIHDYPEAFDISVTVNGFIKKKIANKALEGDVILGIPSSGLHSNGFTLVRKLFESSSKSAFIIPTRMYYDEILPLLDKYEIHGMMHITGGAFSKLKDVLEDADAIIDNLPQPHRIFGDLYKKGVSNKKMYTSFNCGIGFVVMCSKKDAVKMCSTIKDAQIIGSIKKGNGRVRVRSQFNNRRVTI